MAEMHQQVTGTLFLRYLEQSCIVLEMAAWDEHAEFHALPADVRIQIHDQLQVVAAVTTYLDRRVLPTLAQNPEFQELLAGPDGKALIARFVKCVSRLKLQLKRAPDRLN